MKKKRLGRKLLAFLLTLAMVVGLVPGMSMTTLAEEITGYFGYLYEGDILGYFTKSMTASIDTITFKGGGYYIVDNGTVGQDDCTIDNYDFYYKSEDNDDHNIFCDEQNDLEYRPYYNGSIARYWKVVSSEGSSVTLTGYDPGQSNNPFTEDVIYRRYSTDGKPLADGTLSANVGIKVESDTLTWYNGNTYVVSDEVTISDRIKVIGTVNLILLDGAKLTANKGISVNGNEYSGAERKTLNIYAGSTSDTISGTGQLIADARNCDWDWDCAGLGGDDGKAGGVLNIYGGVITAYGKEHGAGIGGGEGNYHNDITIYGGTISAYGGEAEYENEAGAGIGSGYHGLKDNGMGNVKIYGGSVTAVGEKGGAGIGGGAEASSGGDNVYVYGGTVVATGAAGKEGIGKGSGEGDSGNLTLGCVKLETSTDNETWTETTDTGSRTQYMKITPVPHDLSEYPAVVATCTTSGNSAYWKCNRCGKYFSDAEGLNEIAENSWVIPATGHNLSYSADNNTITATCSNSGCELAGKSLSVIAPEEPIFDGSGKEAHISPGYDTTVFPYVSDITYTKDNVTLTGAPVDVGTYVASVSAGASESNCETASVAYAIEPASMTVDASDVNVEYDGNPHSISVNVSKPETGSTVIFGREEGTYDESESPTITDVSDSPFTVYYKVTADNYEDYTGSAKVTITNASQTAPDAPTKDSATATSITLTNVTGCEYSKDGSTWQTSNIFTGLTPDTTYTFYQRKAAVTNYNASLASPGADFSTSAHVHSFSYTADGDTITATCNDQDGCPLAGSDYKATLTISANGGTYDGTTSYEATVTDENSIKDEAVVNYYKATDSGERGEALSPLTTAPVNAGRYWAEITLGTGEDAKTAHVVYTIEKAAETAPAADTNQLNINYPDETISAKPGYEVASDDNGTEITDFSSILDETTPTVYIRKTASDDNHAPSDWVPVTLPERTDAPTGLGSTNATDGVSKDGTITGVNDTMEYSADGTNWTPVNGTTITDLKAGTYKVRVKAKETAPCGNAAEVIVGSNYKALDETVSVIIKKGDSAIGDTVPVVDDVLTADCEASNIIYQWYRDGEPIDGAIEGTYKLTKNDVGKAIAVQAIQTKKADGTNYGENDRPKKMSESTEAVVKKDGPAAPANVEEAGFTPDYVNETFTIGEGYEVSSSDSEDEIITGNSLTDVIDGTRKIYIRVKETEDTKAGAWLEVTLSSRPAAPTGLGSTNATDGASEDGTITGVSDTMEYSADGTNWTSVNGSTITGLKAGTYKVRVKATDDKPAGEIAEVTVGSRKLTLTDRQKPTEKTNLKYNGSDQALLDAPADGLPDGAVKIIYAIGENTDTAPEPDADGTPDDQKRWLTSIPTATDAGTYYVWYKVVGDANHDDTKALCVTTEIKKTERSMSEEFEAVNVSSKNAEDGVINGVDDTMEYSTDGGKTWTPVETGKTKIDNLPAGEYQIRYAGDNNHNPSESVKVSIGVKSSTQGVVSFDNTGAEASSSVESSVKGAKSSNIETYATTQKIEAKDVKVELEVIPKEEEEVNTKSVEGTTSKVSELFAGVDIDKVEIEYLQIDLTKYVDNSKTGNINDTVTPLEIELTYNADKVKGEPVVIRTHNGETVAFERLDSKPASDYKDATYYVSGSSVFLYSQYFSDFALVYATVKTHYINIDYGTGKTVAQIVSEGNKITLPKDLTKEGYNFKGWFSDTEGTKTWDPEKDVVTEDMKLYGLWGKAVSGVKASMDKTTLTAVGETTQIAIEVSPSDADNKKVTFTSSDPNVVTVDENGKVTAVGNGTATITVTTEDGKISSTVTVTVAIPEESASEKAAIAMNAGLKISQTGSKINVSWGKVDEAEGYDIYVAYCGKKFKKPAKTINGNKSAKTLSVIITKIDGKKLNLKKNYKLYVAAYKMVDGKKVVIAKTITGHIVGRKNTKYTNVKKVTVSKSKYTVKVGKTAKIKAKTVLVDKTKKQLSNAHAKEFRYASSDKKVATVNKNGKITGISAGTCKVYVYARNGYAKVVTVTVK